MATRDKLATANEKPTAKLTAKHDKLTAKQEGLATVSSKLATLMAAPDTLVGEHGKLVEGHHNLEIEGGGASHASFGTLEHSASHGTRC